MMNCEQITNTADDFIEGRLRLHQRLMVLVHVAMCKGCRAYLDQFRLTILGLRAVPIASVAAPSEELLELFRQESLRRLGP